MFETPVDTSMHTSTGNTLGYVVLPKEYKKSLTSDNGREFACHTIIKYETGMSFYCAHLYSSWERGTNKNTHGLLRHFLRKKESFAGLTPETLQS